MRMAVFDACDVGGEPRGVFERRVCHAAEVERERDQEHNEAPHPE